MCTALTLKTSDSYFGRNLDLDMSYGEEVVVMPRRYPITFRKLPTVNTHYAIIGMATVVGDIPLYYDGCNEHGLAMAGLNFPGNAVYYPECEGKRNVTPFEFIPYILGTCRDISEALEALTDMNLVNIPFSEKLPLSPLHWIISDKEKSVTVEAMSDGVHIHPNPMGILTNNPPFEYHMQSLANYRSLSITNGKNRFGDIELPNYCQGLGGIGLPGDVSSMSRFVRIAFSKLNSVCEADESSSVNQFFHLLSYVEMPKGICLVPNGHYDITVYSSCINQDRGVYYYTTYNNRRIHSVDMRGCDLDTTACHRYPLIAKEEFARDN